MGGRGATASTERGCGLPSRRPGQVVLRSAPVSYTHLDVYKRQALTAQSTVGVRAIHELPADFITAQLDAVADDIGVDAAKTGMLFSKPIIEAVAEWLARTDFPLVVDPVMVASSGAVLLREDAVSTLVRRLFPRATVITPNLPEAQALTGHQGSRRELRCV